MLLRNYISILQFRTLNGKVLNVSTAVSHSKWQGVKCFDSKVVRLVIEGQNLGGVFPPDSLTRLDQLRVLSLKNNSLTGPIPNLSGLVNLKGLYLGYNHFTGRFPPSIEPLHRIRTLDLSNNELVGDLPVCLIELDRLYYLRVELNQLSGAIPPFNQTTLLVFNVSSNNFSGPIPVTTTLLRFGPSCYSHNRRLCGKIVRREFRIAHAAAPVLQPSYTSVAVGLHKAQQLNGEDLSHKRHIHKAGIVISFTTGVIVLIGSVVCFAMALKERKGNDMVGTMESDYSAIINAAAVMMLEEEREEKVTSALQQVEQVNAVKELKKSTGRLIFCEGGKEAYTVEQLMRGSAELFGRGTVGTTYNVALDNSLIVCVKRIDAGKMENVAEEVFQRHMESVGSLRHPNLVRLRCFFQAKDERLWFMIISLMAACFLLSMVRYAPMPYFTKYM